MTTTMSKVFVSFNPVIWAQVKCQKKKKSDWYKILKLTLY